VCKLGWDFDNQINFHRDHVQKGEIRKALQEGKKMVDITLVSKEPDRKADFDGWLEFHKLDIAADYWAMGTVAWRKKWKFNGSKIDKKVREKLGLHKLINPRKKRRSNTAVRVEKNILTAEKQGVEHSQPGTLCKTCSNYDKCEIGRDAAECCSGYETKPVSGSRETQLPVFRAHDYERHAGDANLVINSVCFLAFDTAMPESVQVKWLDVF